MNVSSTIGVRFTGDAQDLLAAVRQGDNAVDRFATSTVSSMSRANSAITGGAMSAKQLAFSLRGLPAQFTDIVVSLQGGQKPLTVLLQQGGQLKDMFGGIGPAARAMGNYIAALVNPFTVAAAAAAVFAYGLYKGQQESHAFASATLITGNAVGLTTSQFAGMSASLAGIAGTRGKAAEALTEIAATGQLAGGQIQNIAAAAILMEKATGQSVSKTVAEFVKLADEPVKASRELDKTYHYLTESVYNQIRALEDQGNKTGAVDLAEKTYAEAVKTRSAAIVQDVGYIEKAWNKVWGAVKAVGDATLSVGRKSDLVSQLSKVSAEIEKARQPFNPSAFGDGNTEARAHLQTNIALQASLQEQIRLEKRGTEAAVERNAADAAGKRLSDILYESRTKEQKLATEIAKVRGDAATAGWNAEQTAAAIAAVKNRAEFKELQTAQTAAFNDGVNARIEALKKAQALEVELTKRTVDRISSERNRGLLTEREAIDLVADAEKQSLALAITAATAELAEAATKTKNLKELATLEAAVAAAKERYTTRELAQGLAILDLEEKIATARRKFYNDSMNSAIGELDAMVEKNKATQFEINAIGLTGEALARLTQARQDDLIAVQQQKIAAMKMFDDTGESLAAIQVEESKLEQMRIERNLVGVKAIKQASSEAWTSFYSELYSGLTDSLYRAFEKGSGFFKSFWDGILNTFKTSVLKIGIQAVVGGTAGALGLPGLAQAAGVTSGTSLGSIGSIYSSVVNSFAKLGDSVAFAAQDMGAWLVENTSGVLNQAGSVLMQNASAIGTVSSYVSGALAGIGIGNAISGKFAAFGDANIAVIAGTAIGAIFGPLGAAIGGALGGVVNRAFGEGPKETTAQGFRGTLSASGASLQGYSTYKRDGGWFSSGSTGEDYSAVNSGLQGYLDTAIGLTVSATKALGDSLHLNADNLLGFTKAVDLNLQGLDAAGQEAAIKAMLASYADGLAGTYGGVYRLRKEGEGASATLTRLSSMLVAVNAMLAATGHQLLEVSVNGADAASQLADLVGGLDQLGTSVQAYYDAYYSDSERAVNTLSQISGVLGGLNIAAPNTKEQFRNLVDSLDLSSDSGRKAYAVLLQVAPQFGSAADAMARVSQDMAERLLQTFSGRGRLVPLLGAMLGLLDGAGQGLQSTALDMSNATGWINQLLGQASSGLLFFGDQVSALQQPLSGAQLAGQALNEQMDALRLNATGAVTDFDSLQQALDGVDTATYMAVLQGVFGNVASLLKSVLGDISNERLALRDAAMHIIAPDVMSKDQIQRSIAAITVASLPGNAAVVAAQAGINQVDALVAINKAAISSMSALRPGTGALDAAAATLGVANNGVANAQVGVNQYRGYGNANFNAYMDAAYAGQDFRGNGVSAISGEANAQTQVFNLLAAQKQAGIAQAAYQVQLDAYNTAMAAFDAQLKPLQDYALTLANSSLPASLLAAQAAQVAYVASLQDYAIDAGKAADKLSRLREETVKYYDQQKALADLMAKSAAGLRTTVADYRYGQLTPEAQYAQLQQQFNTAYSLALSTGGETLAGYGDKLNALINPLLEKAQDAGLGGTAYDGLVATVLARAEAVAARIDAQTPVNYAADSLALLGQIDTTLSALQDGTQSAERIITDAINLGRDQTVNGLRQVVAALTGHSVAAFASGAAFTNGIATRPTAFNMGIMGEAGSEGILPLANVGGRLGVHAGGQSDAMAQELRALRQEMQAMRHEHMAALVQVAKNTGRVAVHMDRNEVDGQLVRTSSDQPLETTVV